jgi:hypothetical protein
MFVLSVFRKKGGEMHLYRVFTVWLIIIIAEMIHGILRGLFLVPVFGDFTSRQIGVFTGSLIILAVAYMTIRWIGAKEKKELLAAGLIWMALTISFEISFGRFVMNSGWDRILSDFNILNGGLLSLGMIVLMLSPLIAAKMRRII